MKSNNKYMAELKQWKPKCNIKTIPSDKKSKTQKRKQQRVNLFWGSRSCEPLAGQPRRTFYIIDRNVNRVDKLPLC